MKRIDIRGGENEQMKEEMKEEENEVWMQVWWGRIKEQKRTVKRKKL